MADPILDGWIRIASGGLFVLLGLAILLNRPRTVLARAFAVLCIGWGTVWATGNLPLVWLEAGPFIEPIQVIPVLAGTLAAALILREARRAIPEGRRVAATVGLGVALACWAASTALNLTDSAFDVAAGRDGNAALVQWAFEGTSMAFTLTYPLMAGAAIAFVEALRAGSPGLPAKRLWLASAWLMAGSAIAGTTSVDLLGGDAASLSNVVLGATGWVAALWLLRSPRDSRGTGIAILLFCVASALAGIIGAAVSTPENNVSRLVGGVNNAARVLVLAYAVLRLDALDLGLRPWMVGRGSKLVVGLCVMAGFAQVLPHMGVAPVFALPVSGALAAAAGIGVAPLERMVGRKGPPAGAEAEAAYRRHVAVAWQDGKLSPKDKMMLAETRRTLDIGAEAAARIDEEVAMEQVQSNAKGTAPRVRGRRSSP